MSQLDISMVADRSSARLIFCITVTYAKRPFYQCFRLEPQVSLWIFPFSAAVI